MTTAALCVYQSVISVLPVTLPERHRDRCEVAISRLPGSNWQIVRASVIPGVVTVVRQHRCNQRLYTPDADGWSCYTCRTSPSRATISYSTGLTKNPRNSREMRPATMTMAKGFWVSDPMPVD